MKYLSFSLLFVVLIYSMNSNAQSMKLEQFLLTIQNKHRGIKSTDIQSEVSTLHRITTDTNLSPVLSLQGGYLDDQRPTATMPYYLINQTKMYLYSASVSKTFSTGTQAQISANLNQMDVAVSDRIVSLGNLTKSNSTIGTGGLSIGFSQSLWKDFFGRSTDLRHSREAEVEALEKTSYNLQKEQTLIEAELAYWDYLYLQEEVQQRQDSLDRSQKILQWVRSRFHNGIGDKADVLGAEGLVSIRQLQLMSSLDELTSQKKKIADLLELENLSQFPELQGDLGQIRGFSDKSSNSKKKVRLDAYLTILEAKAKSIGAREAAEAMKPDLSLTGSYSTNAYDTANGLSGAASHLSDTNLPTYNVGLKFTWLMDGDLRRANQDVAKFDALASNLKMERKILEAESAWGEMNRRHEELTKKIVLARTVAETQKQKAYVERDKLSKGRTITIQVITAEQDAAESALTLTKLEAEQRKLEAQGRIFINVEGI